jgi:predicted lipoprotein with Yx(FWY)xxD motif
MRRARLLAVGALALAATGGGIAAGVTASGSSSKAAAAPAPTASASGPTIHVVTASVNGTNEQILVDAHSMPLYTYAGDTKTSSGVTGELAALWPPLTSAAPTEKDATGSLTVVRDFNGAQVQYNGHFLYTFVQDRPGQVTGEGVQNFFVATPGPTRAPSTPASASTNSSSGYYG